MGCSFGAVHPGFLPGPLHWLVRLAHLFLGIAAMAMAVMLGRAIRHRRAQMHARGE